MIGQSIYKIYKMVYTPKNQRVYIGCTKRTLARRYNEHRNHEKCTMYPIIRRFGKENFTLIKIDEAKTKEEAFLKEEFWTRFFSDKCSLHNKSFGSKVVIAEDVKKRNAEFLARYSHEHRGRNHYLYGNHLSEETKRKLSLANKGKKASEETKKKQSISLKERYKTHQHHMVGKHLSEETKAKISRINKNKVVSAERCKKISNALSGIKRRPYTKEERIKMSKKVVGTIALYALTQKKFFDPFLKRTGKPG